MVVHFEVACLPIEAPDTTLATEMGPTPSQTGRCRAGRSLISSRWRSYPVMVRAMLWLISLQLIDHRACPWPRSFTPLCQVLQGPQHLLHYTRVCCAYHISCCDSPSPSASTSYGSAFTGPFLPTIDGLGGIKLGPVGRRGVHVCGGERG